MWFWTLIAALGVSNASAADRHVADATCAADAVDLLILGSYHMANPGLDAINIESDDVLQPRRQRDIEELNHKLLRFRPTKVAVEGDFTSTKWTDAYQAYLKGAPLGRNEIEQIGMKIARLSGHKTIYPIDFPMLMNGLRYDEVRLKRPEKAPAAAAAPKPLTEAELKLRRQTVTQNLSDLNNPEAIARDHAGYMGLLEPDPDSALLYERSDRQLTGTSATSG